MMSGQQLEQPDLMKILTTVQDGVKEFYQKFQSETEVQCKISEKMKALAQRYNILISGVPCKRTYPIEASRDIEDAIRIDFHSQLCIVDASNLTLTTNISNLKITYEELIQLLDKTSIATIEEHDHPEVTQQPIVQRIEMLMDIFKYLCRVVSKLNSSASLLRLDNVNSVEQYQRDLAPNPVFHDYIQTSLAIQKKSTDKNPKT